VAVIRTGVSEEHIATVFRVEIFSELWTTFPTDAIPTLSWWWGLSETLSDAGGSVATGRATQAGQVKG
jgi:hypothetical protein